MIVEENTTIGNTDKIQRLIYIVRDRQVLTDSDLAVLYQVETGNLNKAMKRNHKRFPEEFCFQLTKEEYENLKFQNGISSDGEHGGRRNLPYVYTEQGIAMLSAVLRSDIAVQVSIQIMKTFVELRRYLAHGTLLLEKVTSLEIKQIESDRKREEFEQKTEKRLEEVFDYIASHEESSQKIFIDGQIFDAFSLLTSLIQQAEQKIVLIDGYVDIITLNILSKKKEDVDVCIYAHPSARMTAQDIATFNAQYPNLEVKRTTAFHDRFLIIDGAKGYHIGASIKDAGKKCFGINKMEDMSLINDLLQRAEITSQP
jgi:hypothetical protein